MNPPDDQPAAVLSLRARIAPFVPVPTVRLALVIVATAAVLLLQPVLGGVLLLVVLAVAAADAALAPRPDRLPIRRRMPDTVVLETPAEISWTVTNPAGRRLTMAFADDLPPSLRASTRRHRVVLEGHRSVTVTLPIRPARRGDLRAHRITVRTYGPLGLAARQADQAHAGGIRVFPSFRSRDEAELRIRRGRILEVGLRSARGRGGGTEFDHLREYTPDDDTRRIDWAATARVGRPIVRSYRAERNQSVLALLDTGRLMAGLVEGVPRLDHAMDAVLALATVATRLGDRAGLVAFGATVHAMVPPRRGGQQLRELTAALYRLEPELAESDYQGAFRHTVTRFRKRSLLVLLTELESEALTETLLPAVPLVLREHALIVGSVRDPNLANIRQKEPEDASDAYRSASVAVTMDRRQRIAEELTGRGAVVVDAPPSQLAGSLADAYLELKATGRL